MTVKKMKISLASISPRRQELLKEVVPAFEVVSPRAEEYHSKERGPAENAEINAIRKACSIEGPTPLEDNAKVIIAADTIVVLEGRIFGKPAALEEAREMLRGLSGKTHEVITGVAVVIKNGIKKKKVIPHDVSIHTFHVTTKVKMKSLTLKQIEDYFKKVDPLDKAGAYGIQERPKIVERVWGSYTNVVGLPVERLRQELKKVIPKLLM